jgi:hypothetical protein
LLVACLYFVIFRGLKTFLSKSRIFSDLLEIGQELSFDSLYSDLLECARSVVDPHHLNPICKCLAALIDASSQSQQQQTLESLAQTLVHAQSLTSTDKSAIQVSFSNSEKERSVVVALKVLGEVNVAMDSRLRSAVDACFCCHSEDVRCALLVVVCSI